MSDEDIQQHISSHSATTTLHSKVSGQDTLRDPFSSAIMIESSIPSDINSIIVCRKTTAVTNTHLACMMRAHTS